MRQPLWDLKSRVHISKPCSTACPDLKTLSRARTPQADDHSGRLGAAAALGALKGIVLLQRGFGENK